MLWLKGIQWNSHCLNRSTSVSSATQILELKCSHCWDLHADYAETVNNANVVNKLVALPAAC